MIIDLSCPAEIFQVILPTEEIPAASLVMYNLSDRVVVSVEVTLKLLSGSGTEKERVVYRARALNGRPHSTFNMTVPCNPAAGARRADVTIDKVWYNDNAVWRRDAANSVEYIPNNLPVSRGLTDLRFVAGETAVGWPSQQDGLWVCVCGRPNDDREEYCARCRRQKDMIFTRFNREAVEKQVNQRERQLELTTRSAREDTARLQRIREEEYNQKQKRKSRRLRLGLAVALLLVLAAGLVFGGVPALRMLAANRAMDSGDYAAARKIYAELGSFPGAAEKKAECDWQDARELAETSRDPEKLAEASALLRLRPDREGSIALAEDADVLRAQLLLEQDDPAGARQALSLLDAEDPRRTALEDECLFLEAKKQLADGKYDEAREAFLSLSDNTEAADLAAECLYRPAMDEMREEQWDDALALLAKIPEYSDSRERAKECHYKKAERFAEEGDLGSAAAEYLLADDYADAPQKTLQTVYTQAESLLEEGDLEGAMTLYASVPGYEDADEKKTECQRRLAQAAMEEKEYERAVELLSALPETDEKRTALLPQAAYQAGLRARNRKDWESAVFLLETAGDYKDAATLLDKSLESMAKQLLDEGKGTEAAAVLEQIPDSKNYTSLKKKADYLTAVALAEDGGDAKECLRLFQALGKYEEAETWVKRMFYRLGEEAEERGETLEAAENYTRAAGWEDATEKADEQYDDYYGEQSELAHAAMDEGNYALAAALLENLQRNNLPEKYKDLNKLYEDACLEAGKQLYDAGKPYEAKAYFDMIPNNRRAQAYLGRTVYLLLGAWVNRAGDRIAEFREDGTCEIGGESFRFQVPDSYTLKTVPAGEDGEFTVTHRVSNLTATRLSLRDMRAGHDKNWNLFRPEAINTGTEDAAEPDKETDEAEGTGETEDAAEDYTIRDGDEP